ncbi:MAG TPA: hypothetical protein VMW95_08250 [Desulfobacterales bacterium]|nr:hypothetical protein [Desulfobacterales bacterium]
MAKRWNNEDEEFLMKHDESMSRSDLADHFGVSIKSVADKMRRLRDKTTGKKEENSAKVALQDPLEAFGYSRQEFIKKYIRTIDYVDISKLIGINAHDLKEAVEKTGIKLPYERARKWSDLDVGTFISLSGCARCFVQINHNSFIVGSKNCRKCLEKNIKHWIEDDTVINIKLKINE